MGSMDFLMTSGSIKANYASFFDFTMIDGTFDVNSIGASFLAMKGGTLKAHNNGSALEDGSGIHVGGEDTKNLEITGGTINTYGKNYGIYGKGNGPGNIEISGGQIYAEGGETGIYTSGYLHISGNDTEVIAYGSNEAGIYTEYYEVDISGGCVDATGRYKGIIANQNITISGADTVVKSLATDEADSYSMLSEKGNIVLNDGLEIAMPESGKIGAVGSGSYSTAKAVLTSDDIVPNRVVIKNPSVPMIRWVTYEGKGYDIIDVMPAGKITTRSFPSDWTMPEGKHFYGWGIVVGATTYYSWPNTTFNFTKDTEMIATYKNCIVGWEDTGDNGVDTTRGIIVDGDRTPQTDAEVFWDLGTIDIYLKEGYELVDNTVEIINAETKSVIATLNLTVDGTGTHFYIASFTVTNDISDQDTILRFATKSTSSSETGTGTSTETPGTGTSTETPGTGTGTSTETPGTGTGTSTETPGTGTGTSTETPGTGTGTSTETPGTGTGTSTETPGTGTGTSTETPGTGTGTSTETPGTDAGTSTGTSDGTSTSAGDASGSVTTEAGTADGEGTAAGAGSSEDSTADVSGVNTYTVTEGAGGTWDGKSDYVFRVVSSIDNEHCIDRFLWVADNGKELKPGVDYLPSSGSTIITIKVDYLKTMEAGTHNIVVNFTDNSVATTLIISQAAASSNAANVPSTGELTAPTLFVGMAMVVVAAGIAGTVVIKKRREE